LEAAGCRYTRQRAAVYAYLASVDSHPTAEDVFYALRNRLPRISLATVYTSLETLVSVGLATRLVAAGGAARYDGRGERHYHLRDEETGEVRDLPASFDDELLDKIDPQLVERLAASGFRVSGYRLEVLGRFER
jgi:Fe2+ or Zn2+ uptake regulation protein